jgi:hypothetical protein
MSGDTSLYVRHTHPHVRTEMGKRWRLRSSAAAEGPGTGRPRGAIARRGRHTIFAMTRPTLEQHWCGLSLRSRCDTFHLHVVYHGGNSLRCCTLQQCRPIYDASNLAWRVTGGGRGDLQLDASGGGCDGKVARACERAWTEDGDMKIAFFI